MPRLVEQYGRPFNIIARIREKIRIERNDLKWKIRSGKGVLFRDRCIEPIVIRSEDR
jgi:hypothetical protein